MTCLVTGKQAAVARIHPKIKGIINGEAMGNTLVGFNSPSVCSYGKEQSYNAPVSQQAAFAYTAALNYLLADREHVYRLGDATVVCWARGGGDAYQAFFGGALLGAPTPYSAADLRGMTAQLCQGIPVDFQEEKLDPNMDFYILGLSPNAARLSVRFFLHNTFQGFLEHIQSHYRRLEIIRPSYDKFETLPIWKLLDETVNQNARDKSPAPDLAGEVLRAVLNDTRYPATLLNGVALRIRAEREVTRGRAAILKAYYTKLAESTGREHPDIPEEVLQVSLNPDATNVPYLLGRLFSVLEAVQAAANPGINATIRDKYFSGASATPAAVFPVQAADPHAGMAMHEQPAAAQTQSISGKGVIKAIDMDSKKITIAHEAIPAVNWPPMTMRFTITPQTQLNNVKDGDSVDFTFVQQGNLSLLQDIRAQ